MPEAVGGQLNVSKNLSIKDNEVIMDQLSLLLLLIGVVLLTLIIFFFLSC